MQCDRFGPFIMLRFGLLRYDTGDVFMNVTTDGRLRAAAIEEIIC